MKKGPGGITNAGPVCLRRNASPITQSEAPEARPDQRWLPTRLCDQLAWKAVAAEHWLRHPSCSFRRLKQGSEHIAAQGRQLEPAGALVAVKSPRTATAAPLRGSRRLPIGT